MSRSRERAWLLAAAAMCAASSARAQPPPLSSCPQTPMTPGGADEECLPRPVPGVGLVPDLAVLKTPASPAATVLGVVEAQIQRPATPAGLAVATSAGISGGGDQKPLDNFAIEVTPYWLLDHPRLTAGDIEATRPWTFVRDFSISVATASRAEAAAVEGDPDVEHRRVAFGARTSFWPGHPSRAAQVCQRYLDEVARATVRKQAEAEIPQVEAWEAENPRPQVPPKLPDEGTTPEQREARERERARPLALLSAWVARRDAMVAAWDAERDREAAGEVEDPLFTRCIDDVHQRAGLQIDTAAAYTLDFPGADFDRLDEDGSQALTGWLTAAYVFESFENADRTGAFELSALVTGRGEWEWPASGSDTSRLDGGGRLVLAWGRYGVSGEGVYRHQSSDSSDDDLWRVAVTMDYRLSGGTWASATFGKDFGDGAGEHPVIAMANVQWHIGRDRGARVDRSPSEPR